MHLIQRKMLAFVLMVIRHPRWVLGLGMAAAAISIILAVLFLRISTDQNKLFSPQVPFFHRYLQYIHEFPENEAAYVVIQPRHPDHPPPPARWIAAARAISARLTKLTAYVRSVDSHIPVRQLGRRAICFAPAATVKQAEAAQPLVGRLAELFSGSSDVKTVLFGKNRILTLLQHFPAGSAASRGFLERLANSLDIAASVPRGDPKVAAAIQSIFSMKTGGSPRDQGYYYFHTPNNVSRHLLVINVFPRFTYDSLAAVSRPLDKIRAAVIAAGKPFTSQFTFGLTGRPVLAADEMRITTHDTNIAEALAMVVVLAGLMVMLRSIWLALAAGLSLAIAIAWTFGYATIFVGQLNLLSTVFVIALIGIGMDYIIQILVRYRREVRRYPRPAAVWMRVFRYTGPAVATACCGASAAFLVAVFTHFTGDAELGIIAGGGLLFSLAAGFTILPALLTIWPPRFKPVLASRRYTLHKPPPKANRYKFFGLGLWLVALAALSPYALRVRFDPNLLNLQAPGLESVKLIKDMPSWFAVTLSKHPAKLAALRTHLLASIHPGSQIKSTSSLFDAMANQQTLAAGRKYFSGIKWTLPPPLIAGEIPAIGAAAHDLAVQTGNARHDTPAAIALQRLAHSMAVPAGAGAKIARRLTAWQALWLAALHHLAGTLLPPPIDAAQLPPNLRRHFISDSGVWALYIYPRWNLWINENLRDFVRALRGSGSSRTAGHRGGLVPSDIVLTGIAPQLYDSTKSIRGAFTECTILALILVVAIVFLDLRKVRQTILTVSVLLLGLPMLACVMGVLGLNWNFANFFAMPILIGAGHEYGVFMTHRYRETLHNPRRIWRFWDVSERALFMCAFVTCSAFGFLALGRDRGIASLGLVMTLGIACIYLSAILVIRPILLWRLAHKNVYAAIYPPDADAADDAELLS